MHFLCYVELVLQLGELIASLLLVLMRMSCDFELVLQLEELIASLIAKDDTDIVGERVLKLARKKLDVSFVQEKVSRSWANRNESSDP